MKCMTILLRVSAALFLLKYGQLSDATALHGHHIRGSFIQSGSTRWATCTSCKTSSPTSMEQVKLEVLELKDKVDFQLTNFGNILRNFCAKISNDIDTNYLQELQKTCESIDDKIQEINATIKEDYSTYAGNLAGGDLSEVSNINDKCDDSQKRVARFVLDGIDSLREIFTHLANQFKLQPSNGKNENKANFSEMTHGMRNPPKINDVHAEHEPSTKPDLKVDHPTKATKAKSHEDKQKHNTDDSEVFTEPLKQLPPLEDETKHKEQKKVEDCTDGTDEDKDNKPQKQGENAAEALINAGRFQINLEGVPPSAIVRVMDSFKTDLTVESGKFLARVLLQPKA